MTQALFRHFPGNLQATKTINFSDFQCWTSTLERIIRTEVPHPNSCVGYLISLAAAETAEADLGACQKKGHDNGDKSSAFDRGRPSVSDGGHAPLGSRLF